MADVSDQSLLEGSTPKGHWRGVSQNLHKIDHRISDLIPLLSSDPWNISIDKLEHISVLLGDGKYARCVRSDSPALILSGVKDQITAFKRGTAADKIQDELVLLGSQAKQILGENRAEAPIRAAAYFHLKFENMHPLKDGNGRIGRVLLAAQCAEAYKIPVGEIVRDIEQFERNYRQIFRVDDERLRFELLLELLALVLGLTVSSEANQLPFTTVVAFPDSTPLPDISKIVTQKDGDGRLMVAVNLGGSPAA